MNAQKDHLLVKKSQQGDLSAFELLINKYQQKVYALCYRFAGNQEDANDLAQEVFIRLFQSINKFYFKASFSTWLYRVTTNVCLDKMRKRKRNFNVSIEEPWETEEGYIYISLADQRYNPEILAAQNDVQNIVHHAIQQLPGDQRITLMLREIEGFSYTELAQITQVSIGTVKSRLNRARYNLKLILEENTELLEDGRHLKGKKEV